MESPPQPPPPSSSTTAPQDTSTLLLNQVRAQQLERKSFLRALSKTIGDIPGVQIFTGWNSRLECADAAVHRSPMAGIFGNANDGAFSVVVSNMYQDNEDGGDVIIYTGEGGRKKWSDASPPKRLRFGPQISDQSWDNTRNKALIISLQTGNPVRVIRSWKSMSRFAPLVGYRYDGLYRVAACWSAIGQNGKAICRCRLERLPGQPPIPVRPITISTSKRRYRKRLASPYCGPATTDIDVGYDTLNSFPASLGPATGGAFEGVQRVSETSTQGDTNRTEQDVKVEEPLPPPQRQRVSYDLAVLPRYRWDERRNKLVRVLAPPPIWNSPDAVHEEEEMRPEDIQEEAEDDITLTASEAGDIAAVSEQPEAENAKESGHLPNC